MRSLFYLTLLFLSLSLFSCDEAVSNTATPPNCTDARNPIVFLHGFLASNDTYSLQVQRFTSNGYCNNRIFTFDWNTLNRSTTLSADLDAFINNVLAKTGAKQVELVGHSAGGGASVAYLSDAARAAKVAHYVHIGSSNATNIGGGKVPVLNVCSSGDKVAGCRDLANATNFKLTNEDHYEVATSKATFEAMYKFFNNNQAPTTSEPIPETRIYLSGRAVSLGENVPARNATIRIYEVNETTGEKKGGAKATLKSDTNGYWGHFAAKPNTKYVFFVHPEDPTDRVVAYYREGFTHSDSFVYLRTLPSAASLGGVLTAGLPQDDLQTGFVVFSANRAVVSGRDQLTAGNLILSSPELSSADKTTIAYFLYDANSNKTAENTSISFFNTLPFLKGLDTYFSTLPRKSITFTYNGRTLHVPNLKANSEGIPIVVFN